MDLVLQAAGASVLSLPSNELYAAMQTGACDAALTSSTSLTSFRLEEIAKHLTTGRAKSYWFMLEPLLMSKAVFDRLSSEERDVVMSVGAELEEYGRASAVQDVRLVGLREAIHPRRVVTRDVEVDAVELPLEDLAGAVAHHATPTDAPSSFSSAIRAAVNGTPVVRRSAAVT